MTHRRIAVAITALVLCAAAAPLADSRIEFKTTEGQGASFQALLVGHGKLRTDADKTTSVILDPKEGSITLLDHAKKTFTKLTRADIDQLVKTLDDLMKQMEAAMAGMPESMREKMKGMMGGGGAMGAAIEVVDTGTRSSVSGHACRVFQMKLGGRVTGESCMGDPSAIELPAADRATLMAALAWSKDMSDRLSKGPLGRFGAATPLREGLVPLRMTDIAANGSRNTSEFSGVSTVAIPAELFAVPAGYKEQKIELPRGRGGQ